MRAMVFILFFLSGACGLVYEVVWSRVMTQIFGSTVLAVGTVLAAFMSGLALGSYLLGKRADRSKNPLRLYALYEIGIGVAAVGATLLMDRTGFLYLKLQETFGEAVVPVAGVRFVVAFALVLAPTVLMGATLPILSRFVIRRLSAVGSGLSSLYAVNTVGAVAGTLVAGFWVIGSMGIHGALYVTASCNVGIGLIALAASLREARGPQAAIEPSGSGAAPEGPSLEAVGRGELRLLLWAVGLSGIASFAYEIYVTRALVHIVGNSTYAFTMTLASFLAGIALGGYLVRFIVDRAADRMIWFAWLQILIGASSAAALPVLFSVVYSERFRDFLYGMSGELGMLMLSRFAVGLVVMLVPATMVGATFPLVASIFVRDLHHTGASVGKVYAANTVGNVIGALAPGFVLLRFFGIQKGILLMAALNVGVGLVVLFSRWRRVAGVRWVTAVAFLGLAVLLSRVPFHFQFPSENQGADDRVLYYREGLAGTTKVYQERSTGEKRMSIDGIVIGGTTFTDYKQQVLAHFPKLLLREYASELSVGLGSGILIGESTRHPALKRMVCVEIEPSVVEGARYFSEENHGVLDDPRVRIVVDDVANFLRGTSETFDIISADEKTADNYASNGFSYSADYYRLLRERLSPGGLVIQWVPTHLPASQYRMVLRTFVEAFPRMSVWYFPPVGKGEPTSTFLIGSNHEIAPDPDRMNARLAAHASAFEGLRAYGLTTAESILAHYVADEEAVRQATQEAPVNSLESPYYEFYSPREYAVHVNRRTLHNHDLLVALRHVHGPTRLAEKLPDGITPRLREAVHAEGLYLRGLRLQLESRPHAEVAARFEEALATAPWNGNLRWQILYYLWNQGGVHYLRGDFREASSFLGRAVDVYPGHGEVRYYYGLALLQTGATERGLEEMREAVELNPRLIAPRRYLASALLDSGDPEAAAAQLRAILAVEPDDVSALVRFGTYLAEHRSDPAAAEEYLGRAHRLAPDDPAVIDALAWAAYLGGDMERAREIVRRGDRYYADAPSLERRRTIILEGSR